MTLTVWSLIALAVVVVAATVALFSGHIPGVRTWTGAAPLLPEDRRPEPPKERP